MLTRDVLWTQCDLCEGSGKGLDWGKGDPGACRRCRGNKEIPSEFGFAVIALMETYKELSEEL